MTDDHEMEQLRAELAEAKRDADAGWKAAEDEHRDSREWAVTCKRLMDHNELLTARLQPSRGGCGAIATTTFGQLGPCTIGGPHHSSFPHKDVTGARWLALVLPAGADPDDLTQRLGAAYYERFTNDGHPEDSEVAAAVAMSVLGPELDRLQGEVARVQELGERAGAAEARVQAITEATAMWRDRPGGDVGLAIALAGILDTDQPEPPSAAALVRVLRECDRIEREVYGQHDEDDEGMREAVRRIRAAATKPLTRTALDTAGEAS